MSSTKKGANYYFGMKTHIGVDSDSGMTHSLSTTTAKCHDKTGMKTVLHGEERAVFGDRGYASDQDKRAYRSQNIHYGIIEKTKPNHTLSSSQKKKNKIAPSIRAKVEHPFRIVKHLWGHTKVRYKGLYKNTCQQYLLYALANIYMARRMLLTVHT